MGGSGLDDPDLIENRTEKFVTTPYGNVRTGNYIRIYLYDSTQNFFTAKAQGHSQGRDEAPQI